MPRGCRGSLRCVLSAVNCQRVGETNPCAAAAPGPGRRCLAAGAQPGFPGEAPELKAPDSYSVLAVMWVKLGFSGAAQSAGALAWPWDPGSACVPWGVLANTNKFCFLFPATDGQLRGLHFTF